MKLSNKNINQSFLIELLKATDVVYDGGIDEHFYFYPKNFGFTVQVPYSQYSTNIDINFIFEKSAKSDNQIVNLSFNSDEEIKEFMKELYIKNELLLNSHGHSSETMNKSLEALQHPLIKPYPYTIKGENESMRLVLKENGAELNILLGRALYNYETPKKFKPLEPINLECFYKANGSNTNEHFKKVIPAYKAHEYPIIEKFANINKTTNNAYELIDSLQLINPNASSLLSSMLLNLELEKKQSASNKKNKI